MNNQQVGFRKIGWDRLCKALGVPESKNIIVYSMKDAMGLVDEVVEHSLVLADTAAVIYCKEGSVATTIGGVNLSLSKGQLCLLFPNIHSRFYSKSEDFDARIIFINIRKDARYVSLGDTFPHLRHNPIVMLESAEERVMLSLMDYIAASGVRPVTQSRLELDGWAMNLVRSELTDIYLNHNLLMKEQNADELLTKRFFVLLSIAVFEHREVEWFAGELGVTPKKFASQIRRTTGKNPSEIISTTVIKNAKRLLQNTELTSSEIAERLNFPAPSFFCRYFKRYAGVTPSEWRAASKNK